MRARTRRLGAALLTAVLQLPWAAPALAAKTWTPEQEKRAGDEATKAILDETPEWTNDEQKTRCQTIADTITPQSDRPDVKYMVRLLDTDEANAFSLPGGTIFVTRGLLQPSSDPRSSYLVVQSDDELAGIMAHEIAHNCFYHGLKQAERSDELLRKGLIASLLTLMIGGGLAGAFQVLGVGLNLSAGILNHYSIGYETETDQAAVEYLTKTPYNPSGLLTFIERIAAESRSRHPVELGIYQTHPYPVERVQAIRRAIRRHGVEINRRAVTEWRRAEALEAVVHGENGAVLLLWDRTIYTFKTDGANGETPAERAQQATESLNKALAEGMSELDIGVREDGAEATTVTVTGAPLLTVLPGDLDDPAGSTMEGAQAVVRELRAAMFRDVLDRQVRPVDG